MLAHGPAQWNYTYHLVLWTLVLEWEHNVCNGLANLLPVTNDRSTTTNANALWDDKVA